MKTTFTLVTVLLITLCFTSCVKEVDVITPPVQNPITGAWYVSDASSNNGYGWASFNANLPGVFSFYGDGTAQYADNLGTMNGDWSSDFVYTDYYDEYGNYETNSHNDFKVDVSANDGSYVDLSFDDIIFAGNNQFIATYYDGKTIERYTFTRN